MMNCPHCKIELKELTIKGVYECCKCGFAATAAAMKKLSDKNVIGI